MNATDTRRAPELFPPMVGETIATIARLPAPVDSRASSTAASVEHGLTGATGSLRAASVSRLACLFRHWTWADEAMKRFERELADGWVYDEDLLADHPFGAYYHWCALLCGFSEAVLEHGLLPEAHLAAIRSDLEASLPGMQACRQLLVTIPPSLEQHPRIVDLVRDAQTLGRLRRLHHAFGEALREEKLARELDWLLYEH
jgi:hypothetical protein